VPELQIYCGLLAVNISKEVPNSYVFAVPRGRNPLLHPGGGGGAQDPCPPHNTRGAPKGEPSSFVCFHSTGAWKQDMPASNLDSSNLGRQQATDRPNLLLACRVAGLPQICYSELCVASFLLLACCRYAY